MTPHIVCSRCSLVQPVRAVATLSIITDHTCFAAAGRLGDLACHVADGHICAALMRIGEPSVVRRKQAPATNKRIDLGRRS